LGEEIINALTHGLGTVLSVAALVVLITLAVVHGTPWHVASFSLFGATLVILYAASTLYHVLPAGPAKCFFRVLDHAAIYLLIAGTYTPFLLVNLRGAWGWSLFGVVWACAVLGIILKGVCFAGFEKASIAVYVGMGWLSLVAVKQIVTHVPGVGVWLLLGGGLAYTLGVVFYAWRRLPYNHAIWHVWVLCGSTLHFFSVMSTLSAN
jgi:hemolysin III